MTIDDKVEAVIDFLEAEKQASFGRLQRKFAIDMTSEELSNILYTCVYMGIVYKIRNCGQDVYRIILDPKDWQEYKEMR